MNKGRFREFFQCDFDIAGNYSDMIPDAEVLAVIVDILKSLDIGKFQIKINNRKLLDAMVDLAGCEKRKFKAICSAIDKLDKEPWSKVKEELTLQKGVTEEQANKLGEFVKFQGQPFEMLARLQAEGTFAGHEGAMKTLEQMNLLFTYIEAAGIMEYVTFDFSLARGLDYYTGLIYEAVLINQEDGKGVGSISGGGRYDGLIGMFSNKEIPSVGGSIGIERIFDILERKYKNDNSVRATETQVLVAQFGKKLVPQRLKVCAELWAAGIKAETLYKENPNAQDQNEYALKTGIPLLISLGQNEIDNNVVRVKQLNTREEEDVPRD